MPTTKPIGTGDDRDFADGRDTVTYAVALPADAARGALTIVARMQYQAIPAAWARGLRATTAKASVSFLRMYDAAQNAPETLALTVATLDPQ